MTYEGSEDVARKVDRLGEFRDAENANVPRHAGATVDDGGAPTPTPGDRLTGKEAEREIGPESRRHEPREEFSRDSVEIEARKAGVESEMALEQDAGEASAEEDSKATSGSKTQARVEGLIGNPD